MGFENNDHPRGPEGSIWINPYHGCWCLKARDGEVIAEIHGSAITDIWTYKEKQYHELKNAKEAAIRSLQAKA